MLVDHPSDKTVNSAAPVERIRRSGKGRSLTEFEETESMSVYLLAVDIHNMDQVL